MIVETIDKEESTSYSIPVSTSIRFCPLYDPNDNLDEALKGFMFETVGEILSQKKLPKVSRYVYLTTYALAWLSIDLYNFFVVLNILLYVLLYTCTSHSLL